MYCTGRLCMDTFNHDLSFYPISKKQACVPLHKLQPTMCLYRLNKLRQFVHSHTFFSMEALMKNWCEYSQTCYSCMIVWWRLSGKYFLNLTNWIIPSKWDGILSRISWISSGCILIIFYIRIWKLISGVSNRIFSGYIQVNELMSDWTNQYFQ